MLTGEASPKADKSRRFLISFVLFWFLFTSLFRAPRVWFLLHAEKNQPKAFGRLTQGALAGKQSQTVSQTMWGSSCPECHALAEEGNGARQSLWFLPGSNYLSGFAPSACDFLMPDYHIEIRRDKRFSYQKRTTQPLNNDHTSQCPLLSIGD